MQGWIKIHRKLLEASFIDRPAYVSLWVYILLSANHREKKIIWNGGEVTIKPGQFITGRNKLSKACGIKPSTVEDILKFFESSSQIRQQKTSKYRLITVVKWEEYQMSDNKPTTNRQQTDTNKNERIKEYNSEQSSVNNKKDMDWKNNRYSDDFEEGVVDYDSGELHDPKEEQREQEKEQNARYRLAVDWLIKHQGRDPKRTSIPKQLKAIKKLSTMGVGAKEAKQIIMECEASPMWQGREEKPDYWTVVSIIQKRG